MNYIIALEKVIRGVANKEFMLLPVRLSATYANVDDHVDEFPHKHAT